MKIAILSRKSKTYFNDKFIEAANRYSNSNLEIKILDPFAFQLYLENNESSLFYKEEVITNIDLVIPRINGSSIDYGISVIKHFEKTGAKIINGSEILAKCKNKFEILQKLQAIEGIKIPKSVMIKSPKELKSAISFVGGLPVVLKMSSDNNKSLGSILINDTNCAESFLDMNFMLDNFTQIGQSVIVQEFIDNSLGKSVSHLFLGGKIILSYINKLTIVNNMGCPPINPEIPDITELSGHTKNLIIKIAEKFQLEFGIISILESSLGPFVFEVNPLPDVEKFEKIHKIDIVSKLINYIACNIRD